MYLPNQFTTVLTLVSRSAGRQSISLCKQTHQAAEGCSANSPSVCLPSTRARLSLSFTMIGNGCCCCLLVFIPSTLLVIYLLIRYFLERRILTDLTTKAIFITGCDTGKHLSSTYLLLSHCSFQVSVTISSSNAFSTACPSMLLV